MHHRAWFFAQPVKTGHRYGLIRLHRSGFGPDRGILPVCRLGVCVRLPPPPSPDWAPGVDPIPRYGTAAAWTVRWRHHRRHHRNPRPLAEPGHRLIMACFHHCALSCGPSAAIAVPFCSPAIAPSRPASFAHRPPLPVAMPARTWPTVVGNARILGHRLKKPRSGEPSCFDRDHVVCGTVKFFGKIGVGASTSGTHTFCLSKCICDGWHGGGGGGGCGGRRGG